MACDIFCFYNGIPKFESLKTKMIDVVYVTYNAEIELLEKSIESIVSQVRKVYIVDNTPGKNLQLNKFHSEKVEIIYLGDNFGIGYAQNIGIKKALENGAEYIMLSDQDTVYPHNYISNMLKVFEKDYKIVAVAPRFKDVNKKREEGSFIIECAYVF